MRGEVVVIDGSKVCVHNSKRDNYNPKEIELHLAYIELKTNEYLHTFDELDELDKREQPDVVRQVKQKIQRLKDNRIKYEALCDLMEYR